MKISSLLIALLLSLVLVTAVNALPVSLDKVEVDDVELSTSAVNRLDVERGQDVAVEVRLSSTEKLKNVEVEAFLSGFEYNDVSRVSDLTQVFDMDPNVTYVKKLKLRLSDLLEEDDYKLRIIVSDRNNDELVENFALKVDVPRHGLKIKNVILTPEGSVKAGQALLAKVRLRNVGEKDERDVKITVSVPDFGVSGTVYVDEVEKNDKEEESEEVYLRLPKCARAGTYLLKVDVEFDNNHRKISETKPVTVTANDECKEASSQKSVVVGSSLENVKRGGSAVFPVTLTNNEKTSKSFTLNVNAPAGLTVKVSPTSTVLLNAGESQTLYVMVSADENAPVGALSLSGSVLSGSDVLQQLTLTLNVGDDSASSSLNTKDVLQVALVVLLALLILVALVFAFSRLRSNGDEEAPRKKTKAETYY